MHILTHTHTQAHTHLLSSSFSLLLVFAIMAPAVPGSSHFLSLPRSRPLRSNYYLPPLSFSLSPSLPVYKTTTTRANTFLAFPITSSTCSSLPPTLRNNHRLAFFAAASHSSSYSPHSFSK